MAKTHIVGIIDRTGSMKDNWPETIGALNGYVKKTLEGSEKFIFDFGFFARDGARDIVQWKPPFERESVTPFRVDDLSITPEGTTPLYDAIILASDRLLAARELKPKRRYLFVIVTDGLNNSSQRAALRDAQDRIKKLEDMEIPVVYLGVGLSAFEGGESLGMRQSTRVHTHGGRQAAGQTMTHLAEKTRAYSQGGGAATMDWMEPERESIHQAHDEDEKAKEPK